MVYVAMLYGVSSQDLTRICVKSAVPTPGRGHQTKVRAGIAVKLPILSPAPPGVSEEVDLIERPAEEVAAQIARFEEARSRSRGYAPLCRPATLHRLSQRLENTLLRGSRSGGPGLVLIDVANEQIERAVLLADAILKAFEERGHRVVPDERGVAIAIGDDIFRPHLFETTRPVLRQAADKAFREEWRKLGPEVRMRRGSIIARGRLPYNTWDKVGTGKLGFRLLVNTSERISFQEYIGPWWDRQFKRADHYVADAVAAAEARSLELQRTRAWIAEFERRQREEEAQRRRQNEVSKLAKAAVATFVQMAGARMCLSYLQSLDGDRFPELDALLQEIRHLASQAEAELTLGKIQQQIRLQEN